MDHNTLVPVPPPTQIVIPEKDLQLLKDWKKFLAKLSPRIKLMTTSENEFAGFLERAERSLRYYKSIQENYTLVHWPKEEEIAFVLVINSAEPGSIFFTQELDNFYFFCFGDTAFSLTHFEWDGDAEKGDWATTYSLGNYQQGCLTWSFILSIVIKKIEAYENRVPPLPSILP